MHKPDREGGRYAGAREIFKLNISPLLTRGLVHVWAAFARKPLVLIFMDITLLNPYHSYICGDRAKEAGGTNARGKPVTAGLIRNAGSNEILRRKVPSGARRKRR
jgi:hypothetical protein